MCCLWRADMENPKGYDAIIPIGQSGTRGRIDFALSSREAGEPCPHRATGSHTQLSIQATQDRVRASATRSGASISTSFIVLERGSTQ